MNKTAFRDISELTDSREVLTERPHKFVSVFAYILIALLAVALIWSIIGEIDVYVRATGEVRPNDTVSSIRSTLSGRIVESHIEDGMTVSRGDMLFKIDVEAHHSTLEILERQYASVSDEINNMYLFRECIIIGENKFNINNPSQTDYYYRYQKYVTDVDVAVEQMRNTNLDMDRFMADARISSENANRNRNLASSELSATQILLESFERGENLVPVQHGVQYRYYTNYELTIARFNNAIEQRSAVLRRMKALFDVGGVSRNELDAAQFEYDSILLERDSFINEAQLSALQGIAGLEVNISDLSAVIRIAQSMLSLSGEGYNEDMLRERIMLDMLTSISDALFSLQSNSDTLLRDIISLQLTIDEAQVVAPIDGVISMFSEFHVGDFIQAGMDIATIIPVSDGEHRVILAVSNADIADIEIGQRINFRFAALPFADYGEMPGRVTRISTDARSSEGGQSYFMVEAQMDGGSLYDRDGVEAAIRVGMICDARVITDTQKIIFWVLEKLDFIS